MLTEFLLTRIAEDEAAADGWHTVDCGVGLGYWATGECVCGHPARVLAECQFKRVLVAALEDSRTYDDEGQAFGLCVDMAGLWADHPDYQQDWQGWRL